jgi:hypothetical protein
MSLNDHLDRLQPKPTERKGKCVACPGEITETISKAPNKSNIIGPGSGWHWESSGLYCNKCGLMYRTLPK